VLGTLPLALLDLALRSGLATIVTVVVIVVCQLVDSFWLRRRIAMHSVHIGLLVPWVALVGYAVYGVGGVAYGVALAVFGLAMLDELSRRPDDPPRSRPRSTRRRTISPRWRRLATRTARGPPTPLTPQATSARTSWTSIDGSIFERCDGPPGDGDGFGIDGGDYDRG
jgi:hypothetical protein